MSKNEKRYDTDVTQIAFITNRKTLVAACDYLQAPDLDGDRISARRLCTPGTAASKSM